jgi:methionyl-tRNA formyltransferase
MMATYLLLSEKSWHNQLYENLSKNKEYNWVRITDKNLFTLEALDKINPQKIFIPHWSSIIADNIYQEYECIVFHMTDLPFGRGGSPLQNLIIRGMTNTKISAIRVVKELDAGDIYLKRDLSLEGTATDIFLRSVPIIEEMIKKIIEDDLQPSPQYGEPVHFKRRKPDESNIENLSSVNDIYDYIRMLDCEGYPPAFIETKYFKIEFQNAEVINEKQINAHVRIFQK